MNFLCEFFGLDKKRKFNLEEIYKIFRFWNEDNKWGRLEAYTKKELTVYLNVNYDEFELKMTNEIRDYRYYKNHDLIKPSDANKAVLEFGDKKACHRFNEEIKGESLEFFFGLFLIQMIFAFFEKKQLEYD